MSEQDRPGDTDDVDADVAAADAANGEPAATREHPTGEAQAEENRENDPPA